MPRSVAHDVQGGELRVWRTKDSWLHAKLIATREHDGSSFAVESRWDVPPKSPVWSEIAGRARDGDDTAAGELADTMFTEAVQEHA